MSLEICSGELTPMRRLPHCVGPQIVDSIRCDTVAAATPPPTKLQP